jgi:hypothetical protein
MIVSRSMVLAGLCVVACSVAGCSSSSGQKAHSSSSTPSTGSATSASAQTSGTTPASSASTASTAVSSIDPCSLFTAADAQSVLHHSLGAGRKITTGDLDECAFGGAEVIVAVLKGSFTTGSFQSMINSQKNGPYASLGKGVSMSGLGDAAAEFDKMGVVEFLKGSTAISVTTGDIATAKQVAAAVLKQLA